jgi:hypothetical protein
MSNPINVSAPLATNLFAGLSDLLSRASVADNDKYGPLLQQVLDDNITREKNSAYVNAAQMYSITIDGEIEVDDTAQVSIDKDENGPGAYVQAWIYVSDDELLATKDTAL